MGWTTDDLAINEMGAFGVASDIRLRQTDLNLDQIPDYVLYRPDNGAFYTKIAGKSAGAVQNPLTSTITDWFVNPSTNQPYYGTKTFSYGTDKPEGLSKDTYARLQKGYYEPEYQVNLGYAPAKPVLWESIMGAYQYTAYDPNTRAPVTKSIPYVSVWGAKDIINYDVAAAPTVSANFGDVGTTALDVYGTRAIVRPISRYTNTAAQLGILMGNDYVYMDMYKFLRGEGAPEISRYHEKTKPEIAAEKAADQKFQTDLQTGSQTFQEQQRVKSETFSSALSTTQAQRSESFQAAQRALSEAFSTNQMTASQKYQSDQQKLSEEFASDPSGTVRGQSFSEAQAALQKGYSEEAQKRSEDFSTAQLGLSQTFQLGLTDRNEAFQSGRGGSMTTTPSYNRYPSGRVGMKMGFTIPKSGKNIFAMGPLMAKPSDVKRSKPIPLSAKSIMGNIPNMMMHSHKGKSMAAAFGFTHITPIAIAKMPKTPNPPHRPKSVAKMFRPKKGR